MKVSASKTLTLLICFVLLTGLACAFIPNSKATGTTLISDDFEGINPLTNYNVYTDYYGFTSISISSSVYYAGSHSLRIGNLPAQGYVYSKTSVTPSSYLVFNVMLDFDYTPTAAASTGVLYFAKMQNTHLENVYAGVACSGGLYYWALSNDFGTTHILSSASFTFQTSHWYNITLVYDKTNNLESLMVDNTTVLTRTYTFNYSIDTVGMILVLADMNIGSGNIYFDNFSLVSLVQDTSTYYQIVVISNTDLSSYSPTVTISPTGIVYYPAVGWVSNTYNVANGTTTVLVLTAASGYVISGVEVDGTSYGAISSITFSNVQASHTVIISTSTVSTGTNGTVPVTPIVIGGLFDILWGSTAKIVYGIIVLAGLTIILAKIAKVYGLIVGLTLAMVINYLAFSWPIWTLLIDVLLLGYLIFKAVAH